MEAKYIISKGEGSNCQLVIKHNDISIVEEDTDILVCPLAKRANLTTTRVGIALSRACPSLKGLLEVQCREYPNQRIHVITGPFAETETNNGGGFLRCKAIICVTLNPWNPGKSETELTSCVVSLLSKVNPLDAKSISFPPIGYGKALQFPPGAMARAICDGLKLMNTENSLTKAVILAPVEMSLFDEHNRVVSIRFLKEEHQPKQDVIKLVVTPWQAELLPHHFRTFEHCRVTFNTDENVAILEGFEEEVKQRQLLLQEELKNVTAEIIPLVSGTLSILNRRDGMSYVKNFLGADSDKVKISISGESVIIATIGEPDILQTLAEKLKQQLNYKETISSQEEIPKSKLVLLRTKIKLDHLLAEISWSTNGKEIYIEGVKDDVLQSKTKVELLVDEFSILQKSFQISGLHAIYFHRCLKEKVITLLNNLKITHSQFCDDQISLTFSGKRLEVDRVSRALQELKDTIKSKSWDLKSEYKSTSELTLIPKWLASGKVKEKIESFELKEKCIIILELPSTEAGAGGNEDSAKICIAIMGGDDARLDELWSNMQDRFIKHFLYKDYFHQELLDSWPDESMNDIVKEVDKLCLSLEKSFNSNTKKPGFVIQGPKSNVEALMKVIQDNFYKLSDHLPKRRIKSDKAPQRGTVAFMKYAANTDEKFPSYWTSGNSQTLQEMNSCKFTEADVQRLLVPVDSKTKAAVTKLINQTWDKRLVGRGFDAKGLNHTGIKVLDVLRVQNVHLFEKYMVYRKQLFEEMCRQGHVCSDIGELKGSKGKVKITDILEDFMKEELYWEINEHYLLHGTKREFVDALTVHGIDPKVTSPTAMFGRGIYAAERVSKADQYTDSRDNRTPPGTELYMILARMLLGNVFLCDHHHKTTFSMTYSEKLSRPPCMTCLKDKCACTDRHFDSVMGDGKWLFREFVVYDIHQCYPEYVIKYQRV